MLPGCAIGLTTHHSGVDDGQTLSSPVVASQCLSTGASGMDARSTQLCRQRTATTGCPSCTATSNETERRMPCCATQAGWCCAIGNTRRQPRLRKPSQMRCKLPGNKAIGHNDERPHPVRRVDLPQGPQARPCERAVPPITVGIRLAREPIRRLDGFAILGKRERRDDVLPSQRARQPVLSVIPHLLERDGVEQMPLGLELDGWPRLPRP